MAIRSTCAAIRRATTSPRTACATAPSTAAPTRSTCSRSKSTTAPIRCSTARARSAARSTSSPRCRRPTTSPSSRRRSAPTIITAARSTPTCGSATLIAVRLNAMVHRNDVPGRDVENYRALGRRAGDHLRHRRPDQPDARLCPPATTTTSPIYGVPYFLNQLNDGPLPEADDSDYFGYRNLDEQEIDGRPADRDLPPRFQRRCLGPQPHPLAARRPVQPDQRAAGHLLPRRHRPPAGPGRPTHDRRACTAVANVAAGNGPARHVDVTVPPASGSRRPARPGPRPGERAALQPDRPARGQPAKPGGLRNTLVVGGSFTWEDYRDRRPPRCRATPPARRSLAADREHLPTRTRIYTGPINYTVTARSRGRDQQPGDLRLRHARARPTCSSSMAASATSATDGDVPQRAARRLSARHGAADRAAAGAAAQRGDALLLPRRRGVQADAATPASTSPSAMPRTPSSATVRLGCGVLAAARPRRSLRRRAGDRAQLRDRRQGRPVRPPAAAHRRPVPQRAQQFPRALQRSGAARPAAGARRPLAGRRPRARRVAATSRRDWSIFANYTYLDSEVLQSVSDFCLANPGRRPASTAPRSPIRRRGDRLIQTPQHSGSLFTTYRLPVRAPARLRPHLSGQLRDPSAQPAPAHPISRRRFPDPPAVRCPTRSTTA